MLSFAHRQAQLLAASRKVAKVLINKHRAYQREFTNSLRSNPWQYHIGNAVFCQQAIQSDNSKGGVDKIMLKNTGPWIIINKLTGSLYEIRHKIKNVVNKHRASHLSPFPLELMSFTPISGSDNEYGQIHKPIIKNAFKSAGVIGFDPV